MQDTKFDSCKDALELRTRRVRHVKLVHEKDPILLKVNNKETKKSKKEGRTIPKKDIKSF